MGDTPIRVAVGMDLGMISYGVTMLSCLRTYCIFRPWVKSNSPLSDSMSQSSSGMLSSLMEEAQSDLYQATHHEMLFDVLVSIPSMYFIPSMNLQDSTI